MTNLQNKIDFAAIISVNRANANGIPSTETDQYRLTALRNFRRVHQVKSATDAGRGQRVFCSRRSDDGFAA
ncbi:MAG: hypothetical protein ACLRVT_06655 [Oscillospiraceae bacterium]